MKKLILMFTMFVGFAAYCAADIYTPNKVDPKDDAGRATYQYAFQALATNKIENHPKFRFGAPIILINNFTNATLKRHDLGNKSLWANVPRLPSKIAPKSSGFGLILFNTIFKVTRKFDYAHYYDIEGETPEPAKLAIHVRNLYHTLRNPASGDTGNERICFILKIIGKSSSLIPEVGEYISSVSDLLELILHKPDEQPDPNDFQYRVNGYIYPCSSKNNIGGSPSCHYILDKYGRHSYDTYYFTTDDAENEPSNKYLVQCSVIRSCNLSKESYYNISDSFTQPFFTINLFYKKDFMKALNISYAEDIRRLGLDKKDKNLKKLVDVLLEMDVKSLCKKSDDIGSSNAEFISKVIYNAFDANRKPQPADSANYLKAYQMLTQGKEIL